MPKSRGYYYFIRYSVRWSWRNSLSHCSAGLSAILVLAAKEEVNRRRAHLGTHPACAAFNHRSPSLLYSPSITIDSPSTLLPSRHACFAHAPDQDPASADEATTRFCGLCPQFKTRLLHLLRKFLILGSLERVTFSLPSTVIHPF